MPYALSLHNITVRKQLPGGTHRERITILENISVSIGRGEFFVFVGPSGAGKSTLLRVMSGLDVPLKGHVSLGEEITRDDCAFVFQHFALLPWMTAAENIDFGLGKKTFSPNERAERVHAELKRFGLEKFADAYPRELSGGMRQRVGLARAFVSEPKVIFMDEPFSELDSFTAAELRQELLHLWQSNKMTIVMVTHLIEEALQLADRIGVLAPRPAYIKALIENPLPRPRQLRAPEFFTLADELYAKVKP